MSKYLDQDGVLYFWQKLKALLGGKVDKVSGKGLSTNDYTTTEKNKLAGIADSANNYTLPTASSSTKGGVKIGDGLSIDSEGVLSAGAYALPTASSTTKGGVKIGSRLTMTDEVLSADSQTDNNFTDTLKNKLDGIASGANAYVHPSYTARTGKPTSNQTPGFGSTFTISQITSDDTGHVTAATDRTVKIPNSTASSSANGLMSSSDYTKLHNLPDSATLSTALNSKAGLDTATSSANGLMSSSDKSKLDAFGAASTYALKTDISSMYKHKGSVATTNDLPSTGNTEGDVYNVTASGMNYVWVVTSGTGAWDALGEVFTIDSITNSEIDTILAS